MDPSLISLQAALKIFFLFLHQQQKLYSRVYRDKLDCIVFAVDAERERISLKLLED